MGLLLGESYLSEERGSEGGEEEMKELPFSSLSELCVCAYECVRMRGNVSKRE